MEEDDPMRKFILEDKDNYDNFEEFLRALLSTFMPEKFLRICLSKNMQMRPEAIAKGQDKYLPIGGPYDVFLAAFTQSYISSFNKEGLETLGDAALKSLLMLFIFKNFPSVINSPKYLTDLNQFYENNIQFAAYAEQLGFVKWIKTDPLVGLTTKDRADTLEGFVGALVMVGDYYVGEHVGLFLATEFVFKFYSLQDWKIGDRNYYNVAASLFNDWVQSLQNNKPKRILFASQQLDDGTHIVAIAWKGDIIHSLTGDKIITAEGQGSKLAEANENAHIALTTRLGITRETLDLLRSQNREPEILAQEERLKRANPKAEIVRLDRRGTLSIAYVREPVEKQVGANRFVLQEVTYRGRGATPLEAVTDVVNNYIGKVGKFKMLPFNEDVMNPDIVVPIALNPVAPARLLGGEMQREGKGATAFRGLPSKYEGQAYQGRGKSRYGFQGGGEGVGEGGERRETRPSGRGGSRGRGRGGFSRK